MRIELTGLKDFNDVIDYYKQMMNIAATMTPGYIDTQILYGFEPGLAYQRAIVNNSSLTVAQDFNILKENKPDNIDEIILQELAKEDKSKQKFSKSMKKIMDDNNLSPFETLKQVRNSLLHANYSIEIKDRDGKIYKANKNDIGLVPSKVNICLTSNHMSAKMDLDDITYNLVEFCQKLDDLYSDSNILISTFPDKEHISCKNSYYQEAFLDNIETYVIKGSKSEVNNKEEIINKFPNIENYINFQSKNSVHNHFDVKKFDSSVKEYEEQKHFLNVMLII